MQFHDVANIFPMMSADEYEALKVDIARNGLIEPIWTHAGKIIDGRNRFKACQEVGVKPAYREYTGEDGAALVLFVVSLNLKRRHMDSGQLAFVALEVEAVLAKTGKQNMSSGGGDKKSGFQKIENPIYGQVKASDQAAAIVGTNRQYIADAKRIKAEAPALADKVLRGEMKFADAKREVKRAEVVGRLESVDARQAKAAAGQYDVIVIDPPWPMSKIERDVAPLQVGFDYPVMTLDEIAQLQLPSAPDCHVFLWTTQKYLPDAFRMLDVWGAKYVFTMVWHKAGGFQPYNLPQYNCEFVLYGRLGRPQFIDTKQFMTCFEAPRTGHSEKPDHFYDVLRRVTAGRRLDMFNRRALDGFDGWGKEAQ